MSELETKAQRKKTVRYALNKNKYLQEPEAERLLSILQSFRDKDSRNCTLLWLLFYTGARAQEILNLTKDDINTFDQTVFIRGLKGSNDRELPIPSWLFDRLARLTVEAPSPRSKGATQNENAATLAKAIKQFDSTVDDNKLFAISYSRLRQIWELYRPVHKKLHSLRHTFAIRLYRRTKDLRLVQVALGHRNITNTMVYAEYTYSQEELRKALL